MERLKLGSLSARYQQTENANMNRALTPALFSYMVMCAMGFGLSMGRWWCVSYMGYTETNILNLLILEVGVYVFKHELCSVFRSAICCTRRTRC